MVPPRHIVVVGASLAGLRGVETLRREGYEGRITWIGAEPHAPYDRPPLSKQILAGRAEPEQIGLRREPLEELEAELRLGVRAAALDAGQREVVLEGGERVPFEGLLVATGATPRRLPGAPELEGLHVLRTLDDALAIRRGLDKDPRVAVVGAGFIGAEVAATCRGRGLEVAMIDPLPVPLARSLPPPVGEMLAALHRDHGVDLRLGVGVEAVEGHGRVERLALSDGSRLEVDLVVVGIGVVPATGWLEGSGLELRDGVVCDASCATRVPGVVAAGDLARWTNPLFGEEMRLEHWSHAVEQAQAAARSLLGEPVVYAPVPYVWTDQYDRKLQIAGVPRAGDTMRVVEGSPAERRFVALFGRGERLTGVVGMNRPAPVMRHKRQIAEGASWEQALAAASGAR